VATRVNVMQQSKRTYEIIKCDSAFRSCALIGDMSSLASIFYSALLLSRYFAVYFLGYNPSPCA